MQIPSLVINRFFAKQLAHPSGFFGRFVTSRFLNVTTFAHNQLVLQQLAITPTDRILEVGFGGGALLESILRLTPDGSAAGVDISEEMVSNARRHFRTQISEGHIEFHQGKAESLPFPDSSFDKACSVNTIYFWPDLTLALAEFARVIRPGGVLVLGFTSSEDVRRVGLDQHGFFLYSSDELAAALTAQGFQPGVLQSGADMRGTFFAFSAKRNTRTSL